MVQRRVMSLLLAGGSALLTAGLALLAGGPHLSLANPILDIPPFTDTECLACHTDQPRLQELAVEEEPKGESLSSGPG